MILYCFKKLKWIYGEIYNFSKAVNSFPLNWCVYSFSVLLLFTADFLIQKPNNYSKLSGINFRHWCHISFFMRFPFEVVGKQLWQLATTLSYHSFHYGTVFSNETSPFNTWFSAIFSESFCIKDLPCMWSVSWPPLAHRERGPGLPTYLNLRISQSRIKQWLGSALWTSTIYHTSKVTTGDQFRNTKLWRLLKSCLMSFWNTHSVILKSIAN